MTEGDLLDVLREMLWMSVMIATPVLVVALVVGLAIGLFQALTSVQELTLTFVPKMGAIVAVFWLSMSYSAQLLVTFFNDQIIPRIAGN
ncbi:MAG: flagellar biosynthetic protein FliQ [Rhodobacteraceae bacterium]|nr:flagellar biosynthetic protein FliQ [Paracoccaceae bacterium]